MTEHMPGITERLYSLYRQYSLITTDSRKIPPGSIFFALKGEHFDGNRFADQALDQGAAIAVVDDPALQGDPRYFFVDDVLQSLQQLAIQHRKQLKIPVIGITGSNGKTTTKELIHHVLSGRYRTLSTQGNLNNHIGVPLTLLSIRGETEMAVVEMGANHPGEIAFLCEIAKPTHGLITTIGRAHLEGFGGFDGVVRAKTELYTFLRNHSGEVFLNTEDPLLAGYAGGIPSITYGLNPRAGIRLQSHPGTAGTSGRIIPRITPAAAGKLIMEITFPDGQKKTVESALFGSYNSLNILAAACAGFHFGVPITEIIKTIHAYTPANNRSQVHQSPRNLLVLDAYNANPSSMSAALQDFNHVFTSGKIVVLGDMLELGRETDEEHLGILKLLESLDLDSVFLVGPVFSRLNTNRGWMAFENSGDASRWFSKNPVENSTILLKGSRGIRLEEIVPCL